MIIAQFQKQQQVAICAAYAPCDKLIFGLLMFRLLKPLSILAICGLLVFLIYWLWQRQPKPKTSQESARTASVEKKPKEKTTNPIQTPKDNLVIADKKVTLQGQTTPLSYVFIFTNDNQTLAKATDKGVFQKDLALTSGLNLIKVVSITKDLKQEWDQTLTLFSTKDQSENKELVFAGSVKTIFENIITITTSEGDQILRIRNSTNITLPKDPKEEKESTASPVSQIRIGDFAVALAENSTAEQLTVNNLEIIRDNKPQNTTKLIIGNILTPVKLNLFSVKNQKDNQIVELTVSKNTDIFALDKTADTKAIAKDKTAIILYSQNNDKQFADFVYLP